MALEDASNDGVRYFDCGVRCLIIGDEGGSIATGAGFHGTTDEDPTVHRRTKNFGVRHDMARDAHRVGKIRMVYVRTDQQQHAELFTKPLDVKIFRKHAKTDLNIV